MAQPVSRRKPLACPSCKGTQFEVCGLVFYRQPYDGVKREYGTSEANWDAAYPEYVECCGCHDDVTPYFKKRGVLDTFFEVKMRSLKNKQWER